MDITLKYKKSDVISDIEYCKRSVRKHRHSPYFTFVMLYKNKKYGKDLLDSRMLDLLEDKTNIDRIKIKSFIENINKRK